MTAATDGSAAPALTGLLATPRRDPYGLRTTWDQVDGRPVRTLSTGAASDLPEVVMVPGLGAPGYLVRLARLGGAWTRVTLLDLPGWRRGHRPPCCPPTLDDVAVTTARWLEVTGRREVVLLGHSTGAQAVLHTALRVPDRVAGVVLANPTFDPEVRGMARLLALTAVTVVHESIGAAVAAVPSYVRSGGFPLLRLVRSGQADRPEQVLPRLDVPVMVMTGWRDRLSPPTWARQLAQIAGAPCHVLPGAHAAQFDRAVAADALVHGSVAEWARAARPEARLTSPGRGEPATRPPSSPSGR